MVSPDVVLWLFLISMLSMTVWPWMILMITLSIVLLTSYFIYNVNMSMWSSLLLVLVVVAGLMVIFFYVVSIAPSSPMKKMISKANLLPLCVIPLIIIFMTSSDKVFSSLSSSDSYSFVANNMPLMILHNYKISALVMSVLLFVILLICVIMFVNILFCKSKDIRKKFN